MRWKPHRAGIFNIWEYDDQIFEFGDGRLVLRGRNGSGKSNALATLFPFLFDGVMSAARMDPMGGARSMKSLLLGREDDEPDGRYRHDSGTGYVWLEFVRRTATSDDPSGSRDGEEFLTIGAGAAATQHRDADAWFFVTGLRPGHDFHLAEGDIPLTRRQLSERLADLSNPTEQVASTGEYGTGTPDGSPTGSFAKVLTTAEEFRSAVDRHLFGLGTARYRTLVDLLLTLRRPHLAGKLDTEHLSTTLSSGLAELDTSLVDDVAHSFDDLDAMQHELDGLAASLDAVERFLPVYREHLTGVARDRASAVADAHRDLRKIGTARTAAERDLGEQTAQREVHHQAIGEAGSELQRLDSAIETIQQSPAYQDAAALDEVKKAAETAERHAGEAQRQAHAAQVEAERATAAARDASDRHNRLAAKVAAAVQDWVAAARVAGIDIRFDDGFDHERATSVVAQRREEVTRVTELAQVAQEAAAEAERAEAEEGRRREDLGQARAELRTEVATVTGEIEALAEKRAGWVRSIGEVLDQLNQAGGEHLTGPDESWPAALTVGATHPTPDRDDGSSSLAEAAEAEAAASEVATERARTVATDTFRAADRHIGEVLATAQQWCDRATNRVAEQTAQVETLLEERHRVADEPNPGPPANATRPDSGRPDRPGAPLYVCVDFVPSVEEADRAGFEAALAAGGLLDARIGGGGQDDALDARLAGSSDAGSADDAAATLADVLLPVPTAGLGEAAILAALRSVPLSSRLVQFRPDGSWRLGPLAGRYTQPEQLYIGHEARERRRSARLAELDDRIAGERAQLDELTDHRDRLTSLRAQLAAERDAQPGVDALLEALTAQGRVAAALRDRGASFDRAARFATGCRQQAEQAASDLHRTAVANNLPHDGDALTEVRQALDECRQSARTIDDREDALADARQTFEEATSTAERTAETATAQAEASAGAATRARDEQQRYDLLRSRIGEDADRAVQELADARAARTATREQRDRIQSDLSETTTRIATLKERIENLDRQHETTRTITEDADRRFEVICSTQVAEVLALPGVDAEADAATVAGRVLDGTAPAADDATNRMEKAHREILLDGLRAGHDPSMPKVDGVDVVRVGTADGEVPIGTLARQLREEHERTSQLLSKHEREIFETHLLTRVGDALRLLLLEADGFEHRINTEMAEVPTASGMTVELRWEIIDDGQGLKHAVHTLRSAPDMLGPDQRELLREFFMQRIAEVRAQDPGLSYAETLTTALDYRSWHQFALYARFTDGKRQRVTRTFYRGLSGGEAATVLHLPLFAAAAAQYSAGTVEGPRLIALDEAFAGIDDQMRSRLMGLLTQLDLDVVLTSHEFWGFYGSVPSLVLYDLNRRPPTPGVFAQRFDWTADDQVTGASRDVAS